MLSLIPKESEESTMKKIIMCIFYFLLTFGLMACGNSEQQNDNMVKIINKSKVKIYGIGYTYYEDGCLICSGGACNADNSAIKTGSVFVLDNPLFEEEPKSVEIELSVSDEEENEYPCAFKILLSPNNQKTCNIEITGDYENGFCATVVGEN